MIKYKARLSRKFNSPVMIEAVEVERETEHSVWVGGRRHAKRSEWHNFYDSFDEAKAELMQCQSAYIDRLRKELESARSVLYRIAALCEKE